MLYPAPGDLLFPQHLVRSSNGVYTNIILTGNHLWYYSNMDSVIVGRKYYMNITYILSVLDMGLLPKLLVNGNIRENIFF